MTARARLRPAILTITLLLFVSTLAIAQTDPTASLNATQKLQLEVNALSTLNSAIGNVTRKADYRASYLDAFFQTNNLQAEYRAYLSGHQAATEAHGEAAEVDAEVEAALEEAEGAQVSEEADPTGPPAEPTPSAGDWGEAPRDPNRDVPLTYEDAFKLALEYEAETNLADARNTQDDAESLQSSKEAWDSIARDKFPKALAQIMEVERKVQFLKDTARWGDLQEWAEGEYERREAAEAERQEQLAQERESRDAEKDQENAERRAERLAQREADQRKRDEEVELRFQRNLEAYNAETERVRAKKGPESYYYPDQPTFWRGGGNVRRYR
jgi:hypothetical protein